MDINVLSIEPKESHKDFDNKECIARRELIAFHEGRFVSIITARWYMGKSASSSVVYCQAWFSRINNGLDSAAGHGSAGGGGYCKQSAAYSDAASKAGIKFDKDISGRGMSVVEDSMIAFGKYLGYEQLYVSRG